MCLRFLLSNEFNVLVFLKLLFGTDFNEHNVPKKTFEKVIYDDMLPQTGNPHNINIKRKKETRPIKNL